MSAADRTIQRLERQTQMADEIIFRLHEQVRQLRIEKAELEEERLRQENGRLREEIEKLKTKLIDAEIRNGVKQVSLREPVNMTQLDTPTNQKRKEEKETKKDAKKLVDRVDASDVDFRNLDLRVGKIVDVKIHPNADTLYVEKIDVGEILPRTVLTGWVHRIPIEEMRDRMVILCCNLPHVKMRGIWSQAMIMCTKSPDKVETLTPPPEAVPGDRVNCEGYELNDKFPRRMKRKKKIFARIQPNLKTNENREATFKGALWKIDGKGSIVVPTMANSEIL